MNDILNPNYQPGFGQQGDELAPLRAKLQDLLRPKSPAENTAKATEMVNNNIPAPDPYQIAQFGQDKFVDEGTGFGNPGVLVPAANAAIPSVPGLQAQMRAENQGPQINPQAMAMMGMNLMGQGQGQSPQPQIPVPAPGGAQRQPVDIMALIRAAGGRLPGLG